MKDALHAICGHFGRWQEAGQAGTHLGMHRHGRVTQDSFGARGGDGQEVIGAAAGQRVPGAQPEQANLTHEMVARAAGWGAFDGMR